LYNEIIASTHRTKAADPFACLVADILSQTNDAVISSAFYGTYVFVPVVDGTIIMARPTVTLDRQVVNRDVLLSGTNTLEGSGFAHLDVAWI